MLELGPGKIIPRGSLERKCATYQELMEECSWGRGWRGFLWAHRAWLRRICRTLTLQRRLLILHYCSAKKVAIKSTSEATEKVMRCLWMRTADMWVAAGT